MIRFIAFSSLFLLFTQAASATGLKYLIQKAQENQLLLKAYSAKIEAGKNAYDRDNILLLPQISADAAGGYNGSLQGTFGIQLSLDLQKILGKFSEQNILNIEKSRLMQILANENIHRQITELYINSYILIRTNQIYQSGARYFEDHINDIRKQISSGVDAGLDLSRSEIQLNLANLKIRSIESELDNKILEINSLTSLNINISELEFSEFKNMDQITAPEEIISNISTGEVISESQINDLIDKKIHSMTLWKIEENDFNVTQYLLQQSKNYYIPILAIGAQANTYQAKQAWDDPYNIYVALSVPISNIISGAKEVQRAEHEVDARQYILKEFERSYTLRLRQLTKTIKRFYEEFRIARSGAQKAQSAIFMAANQYQRGRIKEIDIMDIYSQYIAAQENMLQSLYNYYLLNTELSYMLTNNQKMNE